MALSRWNEDHGKLVYAINIVEEHSSDDDAYEMRQALDRMRENHEAIVGVLRGLNIPHDWPEAEQIKEVLAYNTAGVLEDLEA